MRKVLLLLLTLVFAVAVSGCSSSSSEPSSSATNDSPKKETVSKPEKKESSGIDTSAFQYADSVDVTDSRDITKHINVVVKRSSDTAGGLAMQQLVTQTYDFLQQEDIKGADTVTIGLMIGDLRVAQFTVDVKKFTPGDDYIKSVMKASKIDKMNNDIRAFGKSAGYWQ